MREQWLTGCRALAGLLIILAFPFCWVAVALVRVLRQWQDHCEIEALRLRAMRKAGRR